MNALIRRVDTFDTDEYIDLLVRSTLAERRPVHDRGAIEGALRGSDLFVEARTEGTLVGAARAVTDFHLACYLADLAVDSALHRSGVGLALQRELRTHLGPHCKVKLSASPAASDYYQRIGYSPSTRAWQLNPGDTLG